ncbi:MAG: ParB N-terminal domain-containing protein [Candidatus Marsarchaeota archaeon]|jgi:hypothetical protein|nr:ParB N-terminal domain-containing protein [Candidatus Marsarchaeota archaeon]
MAAKRRVHNVSKRIPAIIKRVGFNFHWDERKVWKLKIKPEEMKISKLEWMFYVPFWRLPDNTPYSLKPIDVIEKPKKYKKEYKRTMKANLKHPIDIMRNKGKWLLLDGLHRLAKAKILGYDSIYVRKIPRSEIAKIRPER